MLNDVLLVDVVKKICKDSGSTWITVKQFNDFFNDRRDHSASLNELVKEGKLVKHRNCFTTPKIAKQEQDTAVGIMRLLMANKTKSTSKEKIMYFISEFERKYNQGRTLHPHQKDGVVMAINSNFCVLTGGPGTGKTTVVSCIIYCMRQIFGENVNISLTAPTGKAARVLKGSTGENAMTFHKRFGVTLDKRTGETFYEDILFVDESSFTDIEMSSILFNNVPDGRKVVFIGDVDQLPSVGSGAVLRDIIRSGCVPVTMLTHTFRQDNDSVLYQNIKNIRQGIVKIQEGKDYHPIQLKSEEKAYDIIVKQYLQAIQKWGADNVCILIPFKNGTEKDKKVCSNVTNKLIQKAVNTSTCGYRFRESIFRPGDYVMQLENREECVNGDIGKVVNVSNEGVVVEYVDATVTYEHDDLSQLTLAYAMSVHKSQGSEYACVIMVLLDSHKCMAYRNMLYTGVTRAKKDCVLIYMDDAYKTAIETPADINRITFLTDMIKNIRNQYQLLYGF